MRAAPMWLDVFCGQAEPTSSRFSAKPRSSSMSQPGRSTPSVSRSNTVYPACRWTRYPSQSVADAALEGVAVDTMICSSFLKACVPHDRQRDTHEDRSRRRAAALMVLTCNWGTPPRGLAILPSPDFSVVHARVNSDRVGPDTRTGTAGSRRSPWVSYVGCGFGQRPETIASMSVLSGRRVNTTSKSATDCGAVCWRA